MILGLFAFPFILSFQLSLCKDNYSAAATFLIAIGVGAKSEAFQTEWLALSPK